MASDVVLSLFLNFFFPVVPVIGLNFTGSETDKQEIQNSTSLISSILDSIYPRKDVLYRQLFKLVYLCL